MIRRPPRSTLFPSRRSSDLTPGKVVLVDVVGPEPGPEAVEVELEVARRPELHFRIQDLEPPRARSEEHTSELQSLTNIVCRLLLEKKKDERTNYVSLLEIGN